MKAAWYETQGPASEVLMLGEMADPTPGVGELRIRIRASGVNPGDTKKRGDVFGIGMPFPRVIPHSDGAGIVDLVGSGVPTELIGERVWCYGAQSYRPYGTAAEYTVVPEDHIAVLPTGVPFEVGACLGIPGMTAHRAVNVAGPVGGKTVVVQGAGGSVGLCAVQLARFAGARVIGSVRTPNEEAAARRAGAHEVVLNDDKFVRSVSALAPEGVDHVVEVAFAANILRDVELLKQGGTLAAYATNEANAQVPFWDMAFKNIQIYCLGSDDFPQAAKAAALVDLNGALQAGWHGFDIGETIPLQDIAQAHNLCDHPARPGRIVLSI